MASIINATTTAGVTVTGDNSGSLQLATNNGTTAVTINTAQKVGIGTTPSGSYILEVNGNPNFNSVGGVYLTCGTYDVIKNPSGNIIAFGGVTSSQWDTTALYTGGTEQMRITSAGRVLVNKTVSDMGCQMEVKGVNGIGSEVTTATGTGLQVTYTPTSGLVYWCNWTYNGSGMGSITSSGSTTAYNTGSDYRLKENIAPMTGALAKVAQLKPSTWTWKRNGSDGQGFIAHELAEVCPDAVVGEKDAVNAEGNPIYQGVDTSFLVATLTAAIQELKAELDATKAEVQALKGTI